MVCPFLDFGPDERAKIVRRGDLHDGGDDGGDDDEAHHYSLWSDFLATCGRP